MQKKSEKIIFTLYLLGFLALALTLALLQPLANTPPLYGNPPDEHARYLIRSLSASMGRSLRDGRKRCGFRPTDFPMLCITYFPISCRDISCAL